LLSFEETFLFTLWFSTEEHRLIRHAGGGAAPQPTRYWLIPKFLDEQNPKEKPFSTDTMNDLLDLKDSREMLDPKKQKKLVSLYGRRIKRLESLKEQKATK
jgi:hypothetical protein